MTTADDTTTPSSIFKTLTQPESYSMYVAIVALSSIIVVISSTILLMFLYLQYKRWTELMKTYNSQFVRLQCLPPEIRTEVSSFGSVASHISQETLESRENLIISKPLVNEFSKPISKKEVKARVANIQYPDPDSPNGLRIISAIEIEPKNVDDIKGNIDKLRKSYGPDMELGRLSFSIEYISKTQDLIITELSGEGLRKQGSISFVNPYIAVHIWPDTVWSIKTKVMKKTSSTKWEEKIVIEGFDPNKMSDKALYFVVNNFQRFKPTGEIIGHVIVPFAIIDFNKQTRYENITKNIQPTLKINKGSIKILLEYKMPSEMLEISIMRANIIYDPSYSEDQLQFFVRMTIDVSNDIILNSKTKIVAGTKCPEWNETFKVKFKPIYFENGSINFTIREESFSKEGKIVAYMNMGLKRQEDDKIHFYICFHNPNTVISQWHQLLSKP